MKPGKRNTDFQRKADKLTVFERCRFRLHDGGRVNIFQYLTQ